MGVFMLLNIMGPESPTNLAFNYSEQREFYYALTKKEKGLHFTSNY